VSPSKSTWKTSSPEREDLDRAAAWQVRQPEIVIAYELALIPARFDPIGIREHGHLSTDALARLRRNRHRLVLVLAALQRLDLHVPDVVRRHRGEVFETVLQRRNRELVLERLTIDRHGSLKADRLQTGVEAGRVVRRRVQVELPDLVQIEPVVILAHVDSVALEVVRDRARRVRCLLGRVVPVEIERAIARHHLEVRRRRWNRHDVVAIERALREPRARTGP
jgi:hypothetical protein